MFRALLRKGKALFYTYSEGNMGRTSNYDICISLLVGRDCLGGAVWKSLMIDELDKGLEKLQRLKFTEKTES